MGAKKAVIEGTLTVDFRIQLYDEEDKYRREYMKKCLLEQVDRFGDGAGPLMREAIKSRIKNIDYNNGVFIEDTEIEVTKPRIIYMNEWKETE